MKRVLEWDAIYGGDFSVRTYTKPQQFYFPFKFKPEVKTKSSLCVSLKVLG